MALLDDTLRIWALHREFRAVLAELKNYPDHKLGELGLTRGDITRAAYEEAERRIGEPAASRPEASGPAWLRPVTAVGQYR